MYLAVERPCYRPQRSCSKAIFSQACVKNSVHRGDVCHSACWDTPSPGRHPTWADTPQAETPHGQTLLGRHPQAEMPPGQTPLGRHPGADTPLGRHPPPQEAATAADGTHPTGMHSCIFRFILSCISLVK